MEIPFSTTHSLNNTERQMHKNYTRSTISSVVPTCFFLLLSNSYSGCSCPPSAHSVIVAASIPFIEKCFPAYDKHTWIFEWEIHRNSFHIFYYFVPTRHLYDKLFSLHFFYTSLFHKFTNNPKLPGFFPFLS